MQFMTVKQLADDQGVTYESIRRLISRHSAELAGHIHEKNRVRYLDEWAVDFLKKRRRESPIVVHVDRQDEELESLRSKLEVAQREIVSLQSARIADQEKIISLMGEVQASLEDKAARETAEARAADLERQHDADREEISRLRSEVDSYKPSLFGFYRKK